MRRSPTPATVPRERPAAERPIRPTRPPAARAPRRPVPARPAPTSVAAPSGATSTASTASRWPPASGGMPRPARTPRAARPLAEWPTRPRILVTNDDGIESRGLLALKQALEPLGDVYVLAPETNQSAVGPPEDVHAPAARARADARRRRRSAGRSTARRPTRSASPSSATSTSASTSSPRASTTAPTWATTSPTRARSARRWRRSSSDCPAFAISQEYYEHPDFTLAARDRLRWPRVNILEHGLGPGRADQHQRARPSPPTSARASRSRGWASASTRTSSIERLDPRGMPYYWIGGPPPSGLAEPGTDFHARRQPAHRDHARSSST